MLRQQNPGAGGLLGMLLKINSAIKFVIDYDWSYGVENEISRGNECHDVLNFI